MKKASRRRTSLAVAVSVIAHVAVTVALLMQRPELLPPLVSFAGPPEPIIPILIMPKTPPHASGKTAPQTPIRLHRRPQPFAPAEVAPAPIAPRTPAPIAAAPTGPPSPPAFHPAPQPEGPKGDVRTALRQGYVGCANPQAVGLNKAERDVCDEKFGRGAKDAQFVGLGLAGDKQRLLDAAGARKEADIRYKQAPATPNTAAGAMDARNPPSAKQMCESLGVAPEQCEAHGRR